MVRAIRIWRVLSWISGCVFILPSAFLFWMDIRDEWSHPETIALFGLYLLASLLGPVSAIGIKRTTRWARPVGWIAVVVQILAGPIFTPLGVFGLFLLYCGAGKPGTDAKSSPIQQRALHILSVVLTVVIVATSIDISFGWAKHLGYPDAPSLPIALLMLWTCLVLDIVLHEAGHALAVKLVRGQCIIFRSGHFGGVGSQAVRGGNLREKLGLPAASALRQDRPITW
jgi:hypothetical protein